MNAKQIEKFCLVCGKRFVTKAKRGKERKYCSVQCKRKQDTAKQKSIKRVKITKHCIICGVEFQTRKVHPADACMNCKFQLALKRAKYTHLYRDVEQLPKSGLEKASKRLLKKHNDELDKLYDIFIEPEEEALQQ